MSQTNGGTSKAHNTGLANATGQYVTFMDIDDELDPCMYETLIGMMDETCADIVNRGYWFKVETDILGLPLGLATVTTTARLYCCSMTMESQRKQEVFLMRKRQRMTLPCRRQ